MIKERIGTIMRKYLIKKIQKRVYTKLDDIMGNPIVYDYQKTLFKLTIVLFIGIQIIKKFSLVN